MTCSGKNGLNIRTMQVPNWTGPGVRRSKRPLLASRARCNVLWKPINFEIRSKSAIKSISVISSQMCVANNNEIQK